MILLRLKNERGELHPKNSANKKKLEMFLKQFWDDTEFEAIIYFNRPNGKNKQLAAIHAIINDIAKETNESPDAIKLWLKEKCGLVLVGEDGEMDVKSFADASSKELSLIIGDLITLAESVGLPAQHLLS